MTAKDKRLGYEAKDMITGFKGIVTSVTQWMTGCDRLLIQPQDLDKDGKPVDASWFDENQVIILSKKKKIVLNNEKEAKKTEKPKTGGPQNDPKRW